MILIIKTNVHETISLYFWNNHTQFNDFLRGVSIPCSSFDVKLTKNTIDGRLVVMYGKRKFIVVDMRIITIKLKKKNG